MLEAIEIVMFAIGLELVVAGRFPSIPFVKSKRRIGPRSVRLLGLILMLPFPLALAGGILLRQFMQDAASNYDLTIDLAVIVGGALAALLVGRWMRRRASDQRARGAQR